MNDRLRIAAKAIEGILIGTFSERPNAKPTPAKVAQLALTYADALIEEERNTALAEPAPAGPAE